jgi:hypothetical protein
MIKRDRINVCIELIEDVTPPTLYIQIDHHNNLNHLPSSIEQLSALLGLNLTRYQQLVAENDKNYIPGLIAFGATILEIHEIRQKDREIQGVTKEDEHLAELSIKMNLNKIDEKYYILKSKTSNFSIITDQLYGTYDSLIIYTNKELTYYGQKVGKLNMTFEKFLFEKKAHFGLNYFAIFDTEITTNIINKIIELTK